MVCKQVTIYITYIVLQIIVSICLLGSIAIPSLVDLLGPLIGIGVIHLLCKRKSFTIASVLVGLTVSVGVLTDLLCFSNLKCCRWLRGKTVEGLSPGKNRTVERKEEEDSKLNKKEKQAKKDSDAAARQADAAAKKAARAAIRYKELSMEKARQQKELSSPNRKRRILFDTDSKRLYRNQQKQMNQYGTSSGMNDSDQYARQWENDDNTY